MTAWKRSARCPARLRQRQPVVLHLERLEDRLLLNAGSDRPDASALMSDMVHVGKDWKTVQTSLVNAVQASQTNLPAPAAAMSQFGKAWSTLAADWNQMRLVSPLPNHLSL